ncbi:hypothetical protein Syun_003536 [Stephania yunnanensis]|uniref:Uncharacterized protein n=1 Tax=Stephania yunnanensis TaxID=152371 RepID=A0AAP0L3E7_9MAGN
MWARFKPSKVAKDIGDQVSKEAIHENRVNVNEEYLSAFRTKSYADVLSKAQFLTPNMSDVLLEPEQESISVILENMIFSKKTDIRALISKYFDISAESSRICTRLLRSINQVQSNYKFIQRALDLIDDYSLNEQFKLATSALNSFNLLSNPFSMSSNNLCDFKLIHDGYASVLNHLKLKRKKITEKIKLIRFLKKASNLCVTAVCGAVGVAVIVLAAHTVFGLLASPAIFTAVPSMKNSFKTKKTITKGFRLFWSTGFLRKLGIQLDVAAKGVYILNRDFDTMSRLVARLHDEIEHSKGMIRFCLERREDKYPLQEVVKELKKSDIGFRRKVEELEDHVYLCLVTINRARVQVMKEMTALSSAA